MRHEFIIENPTANLVRIVQSVARMPCCSAVEDHPREIQPYGKVAIPVVLKPGRSSGVKNVSFLIETDQSGHDRFLLELVADLRPEWEVVAGETNWRSVPLGAGGQLAFEVICRQAGETGLSLPDAIEIPAPFQLANDPAKSVTDRTGRFVETRRPLVVDLPPASPIGLNRGTLRFRWNDGRQREHEFGWEVVPAVRAAPSILIFRADEGPKDCSIALTSDHRPFLITDVACSAVAAPPRLPTAASRVQQVAIRVDPARIDPADPASAIRLRTDHPAQTEVTIKLMILGGNRKEDGR